MAIWNHIAEHFLSRLAKRKRAEQEAGRGEGEEHDEKEEKSIGAGERR